MSYLSLKEELIGLGSKKLSDFTGKLTRSGYPVLGVRVPDIIKIAKKAAKSEPQCVLDAKPEYLEEVVLKGAVIAFMKIEEKERIRLFDKYTEYVDDWIACDVPMSKYNCKSQLYFDSMMSWLDCSFPFKVRCAMIALMHNFADSQHIPQILNKLRDIDYGNYYVMMGGAWLLSVIYLKDKDGVMEIINDVAIDYTLRLKTISKLRDSFRVSKEDKEELKLIAQTIKESKGI